MLGTEVNWLMQLMVVALGAVIITDSSHVILSAIQPETVANRFVISREHQVVDN